MTEKCCKRIRAAPIKTPERHLPSKLAAQRHPEGVPINKSVGVTNMARIRTKTNLSLSLCAKNVMLRLYSL